MISESDSDSKGNEIEKNKNLKNKIELKNS
jgi:hypothetical protein